MNKEPKKLLSPKAGYNQYTSPKLTPSDAVNNRRIAVNNIRLEKTEEKFNVNSIL